MTHPLEFKHQASGKLKQFQEFVFVSDSAMKTVLDLDRQLHFNSNSTLLHQAEIGNFFTIEQIHAPRNVIRQLRNLKFKPDRKVQLVSKTNNGSVIVSLNNTLVGISKEIAQRIVVAGEVTK